MNAMNGSEDKRTLWYVTLIVQLMEATISVSQGFWLPIPVLSRDNCFSITQPQYRLVVAMAQSDKFLTTGLSL